jgi:hypothetical protein
MGMLTTRRGIQSTSIRPDTARHDTNKKRHDTTKTRHNTSILACQVATRHLSPVLSSLVLSCFVLSCLGLGLGHVSSCFILSGRGGGGGGQRERESERGTTRHDKTRRKQDRNKRDRNKTKARSNARRGPLSHRWVCCLTLSFTTALASPDEDAASDSWECGKGGMLGLGPELRRGRLLFVLYLFCMCLLSLFVFLPLSSSFVFYSFLIFEANTTRSPFEPSTAK